MIYSKNRISSIAEETTVNVNENYLGVGALYFMEECVEDELSIFASTIDSDSKEFALGESADSSAITALNESFVNKAVDKIKEIMTKFIEWISSVANSAYASLQAAIIKGNKTVAKTYKLRLAKKKDTDFKFEGEYLDSAFSVEDLKEELHRIEELKKVAEGFGGSLSKEDVKANLSVSDSMKKYVKTGTIGKSVIEDQISLLEKIAGNMKEIKRVMDNAKKNANAIIKGKKNLKEDDKNAANDAVQAAAAYRMAVQKVITFSLNMIKAQAKVARKAIAKGLGAKAVKEDDKKDAVKESVEFNDLDMLMLEADIYDLDEALESCSKNEDCDDCDDDLEDGDDEDSIEDEEE